LAKAKEKGMARMALKGLAYTPWKKGERRTHPKCWYKPIADPELAAKALRFTLSQPVATAAAAGDVRLLKMLIAAAEGFTPFSAEAQKELLASAKQYKPLFEDA
jgi:hypothetical protein